VTKEKKKDIVEEFAEIIAVVDKKSLILQVISKTVNC
jgi:hypothetical protein